MNNPLLPAIGYHKFKPKSQYKLSCSYWTIVDVVISVTIISSVEYTVHGI